MSSLEKGCGLCSWTLRSSVSLTPIDSGRSAIHPYSAGSTEAQWLARDYTELVADFWLEATSFYSQFSIFPFNCFWKCPLLLEENNSRQDIIKYNLNNQLPLYMGKFIVTWFIWKVLRNGYDVNTKEPKNLVSASVLLGDIHRRNLYSSDSTSF